MVTLPLFLILLICAYLSVKHGKTSAAGMALGVLLGLSLASTSLGPPLLGALTDLSTSLVSALSSAAGGA